jgi:hypothetical protein
VLTLVEASGATFLDRSANGGKTWTQTVYRDGGTGMRDLAYVSATTGYLVHVSDSPVLAYGPGPDEDHQRGQDLDHHQDPLTRAQSAQNKRKTKTDEMERTVAAPHRHIDPGSRPARTSGPFEMEALPLGGGGA